MKPTRNVGNIPSLHLPRVCEGLRESTSGCKLDPEIMRRLKTFFVACKPLEVETHLKIGADTAEATIREVDLRVDRNWHILRDIFAAYGRLADVNALGAEAARIHGKYFADMEFTRFDTSAQLTHGTALLACLDEAPISKELLACVRPVLAVQKVDHAEYAAAIQAGLVYVERVSNLAPLRKVAADALQELVTLVEVLASSPEQIAEATAILAPVDATLEKIKPAKAKSSNGKTEDPTRPEEVV